MRGMSTIRQLRAVMVPGKWYTFDELYAMLGRYIPPEKATAYYLTNRQLLNDEQRQELNEGNRSGVIRERMKDRTLAEITALGRRKLFRANLTSRCQQYHNAQVKRKGKWPHAEYMLVKIPCPLCGLLVGYRKIKDGMCPACREVRTKAGL